jgi:hypothetical protein
VLFLSLTLVGVPLTVWAKGKKAAPKRSAPKPKPKPKPKAKPKPKPRPKPVVKRSAPKPVRRAAARAVVRRAPMVSSRRTSSSSSSSSRSSSYNRGGSSYNRNRSGYSRRYNNRRGYSNRRSYGNRPRYYHRNRTNRTRSRTVTAYTDYTVTLTDAAHVRSSAPPLAFDDKGNPKKYSPTELQALKGDDPAEKKLVGYRAAFSDLKPGDQVTVSLGKHAPGKGKDQGKDTWIASQRLAGKVMKVGGSKTLTVRVSRTVTQNINNNQNGNNGNNGNNTNNNRGNKPTAVTVNPAQEQATLIVVQPSNGNGNNNVNIKGAMVQNN